MNTETITITCADGYPLASTLFHPTQTVRQAVVIAPGLGMPRGFYARLATYLAENGVACLTFDYRGLGDSQAPWRNGRSVSFHDWGRYDIEAAIIAAQEHLQPEALFLLGHSCGGQLAGLAPNSTSLSGMVFVASQLAHWRLWPFPHNLRLLILWQGVIPLLVRRKGLFPARKFGISAVDVPNEVMAQWAAWARHRRYLFEPSLGLDTSHYPQLTVPLLAYGFSDDAYATAPAIDALLAQYSQAKITRCQMDVAQTPLNKVGHSGFFRAEAQETLWQPTVEWLKTIN